MLFIFAILGGSGNSELKMKVCGWLISPCWNPCFYVASSRVEIKKFSFMFVVLKGLKYGAMAKGFSGSDTCEGTFCK